jgi:hypothetical protein
MSADKMIRLITIHSYDNAVEAGFDRGLLENHGIDVVAPGLIYRKTGLIELRVREEDVARAADILRSVGRIPAGEP